MRTPLCCRSVVFYYRKGGLARKPNTHVITPAADDHAGCRRVGGTSHRGRSSSSLTSSKGSASTLAAARTIWRRDFVVNTALGSWPQCAMTRGDGLVATGTPLGEREGSLRG